MAGGFVLDMGAVIVCPHGGQAVPAAPTPRVRLSGQPAVPATSPFTVAGCANITPDVTAQYVSTATRVRSGGVPLLLNTSQAMTAPNGLPLTVVVQQLRVKGT